jgi:glycine/D-amino acid oxidase-like deaminating enzyme
MKPTNSPWLHQLIRTRPVDTLKGDIATDIAIVGAGIAGVMTAYFTLRDTNKQVLLVEGGKVAHGATGHNAGQIVFEFEREFYSLVEEYGLVMAADAENSVRGAWILLEQIFEEAKLTTPMSSFLGYNGFTEISRVVDELRNNALRLEAGMQIFPVYISETAQGLEDIPKEYTDLYSTVPHADVLSLLETHDKQYVAVMSERKGCVNSAMLIEEIVGYMIATFKERFMLCEETHIHEVILEKDLAILLAKEYSITADKVILCTNGFEKFSIINNAGADIDVKFHHMVRGKVGYMAGYLEELKHPPIALSFYDQTAEEIENVVDPYDQRPYIYMTRRPYELEKNEKHNLICVGGPEHSLDNTEQYVTEAEYSQEAVVEITDFLHKTYQNVPKGDIDFRFKWHGLMGYTPTSIRVVGEEPKNRVLMYNLGCNGVGILTSIYGGKRISEIVGGAKLPPSLFDPRAVYVGTKSLSRKKRIHSRGGIKKGLK